MVGSQVCGWGGNDDVCYSGTSLGVVLAFNVPVEDTGFSCEGGEWEAKYLVTVALTTVGVDVDGDGDDGEENLVFHEIALVEEFI